MICFEDLPLQRGFSSDLEDILLRLTHKARKQRLGYGRGADDIKNHPFFKSIDWERAANLELRPPIVPDANVQATTNVDCPHQGAKINPYEHLGKNFDTSTIT